MIPKRLLSYYPLVPLLKEVKEWSLLRDWSLSEVYRVRLISNETYIVKWGGKEMAREAAIYQQLVHPLKVTVPQIYTVLALDQSAIIIMKDCGKYNLEQRPTPELFLEAARSLARLRKTASNHLKGLPDETARLYTLTAADFMLLLNDLLQSDRLSGNDSLIKLQNKLPNVLDQLYQTVPLTLVHHDFHAKNLLIQEKKILPVDWSLAYISPHLGDLYCLITEAKALSNVTKEDILSTFLDEADIDVSMAQLNWQISVGGICWLIKSLKWLAYGGTNKIPGSDAWIPDLIRDVENLITEIT